ncbi:MAG: branched-chain amino acid ABC transporter permease [Acetobacteraceae bacterium]|nr:branched-chain amino acid ABC transporter permease [Acetobacteraceae bacterium]
MFSLPILAQILWTSLATSTCFVLFALAFALVLKVNRIFNFAQAAMMTVGFYAAYTVIGLAGGPGWLGFLAALAASVGVAVLLEIFGFRPLRRRRASSMFVFIFALVISELIAYVIMLVYGTWPATIFPSLFWPVTLVGPVAVSQWDVPAVVSTIAAIAALFAFLHVTRSGQFMTAVADNPDLAEFYGITKDRIHLITMIVAGLLTGLAMFLYGSRAQVQPMSSIDLLLFAIAATIIGGIGNLGGTAITAVVLGIVQNASVLFIPSEWQGFLLYVFLFTAIVFFPKGIRLPERRLARSTPTPSIGADEAGEA